MPNVRNLGVYLDHEIKMKVHVSVIVKSADFHIRKLYSVRKYVTEKSMKLLVQCIVNILRLGYCNSLLYEIPEESLEKLQKVQNAAANLMYGIRKHDHVTHLLKDTHWLPIRFRFQFKIALITFKTLNGNGL